MTKRQISTTVLGIFVALSIISCEKSRQPEYNLKQSTTIYGTVSCEGRPLPGVVVSDGVEVVSTNEKGQYQLTSDKKYGYVFISTPSGYTTESENFLPDHYTLLSRTPEKREHIDFELVEDGNQTEHTMLVFGDIHLANKANDIAQFKDFTKDVNNWVSSHKNRKTYGLTLGDMTWDVYWISNKFDLENYVDAMSAIKDITIYQTIGNHDHSCYLAGDFGSAGPFRQIIGPTFYSFNIGDIHYVVLDDIIADNTGNYSDPSYGRNHKSAIADDNIAWLKKDLSYVNKNTPVVVAMHAPLYYDNATPVLGTDNAEALMKALEGYKVHFLTGHTHKMYNIEKGNIYEHNSAAVCATWWWTGKNEPGIHVCQDGAPGGYRIFNAEGTDISWSYKATGHPEEYQFRSYDRNEILITGEKYCTNATAEGKAIFNGMARDWNTVNKDNFIYINVWDYDPTWTVTVTENGKELPCEKVAYNADPLHLVTYSAVAVNINSSKPIYATSNNKHTFRAKATSANSTVEIKVTDRFGRVYTETMTRPKAFEMRNYK